MSGPQTARAFGPDIRMYELALEGDEVSAQEPAEQSWTGRHRTIDKHDEHWLRVNRVFECGNSGHCVR